jgi:hypothetical protein
MAGGQVNENECTRLECIVETRQVLCRSQSVCTPHGYCCTSSKAFFWLNLLVLWQTAFEACKKIKSTGAVTQ